MIFLVVSLAMLAGWIWLAVESKGPGLPLIGLARRIRRERRASVAAASPGLRFHVEVLTPAAHQRRAQSRLADIVIKRCGACKKEVPASSKVGDFCPHCGVHWGFEEKERSS